jgi:hypothetical protein
MDCRWCGSLTLAILSGLSMKSTVYGFDSNAVNETDHDLKRE